MIRELDNVVLIHDIEDYGLERDNVGVAVHCYPYEAAFEVEFVTTAGDTAALLTLTGEDIRPMSQVEGKVHLLDVQIDELDHIVSKAENDSDFDAAEERLDRWKKRTVSLIREQVNPDEASNLEKKSASVTYVNSRLHNLSAEGDVYRGFLQALREEIQEHPDGLSSDTVATSAVNSHAGISKRVDSEAVFIVHGHDEANMLKLEKLLKNQWGIDAIILKDEPGEGRTLIEKFEEEAERARYAFVLITPDDLIETPDGGYTQARPNVIFELGWFYGHIGRHNVCILCKAGTELHSDLDGINRVDFNLSVEEEVLMIEKELRRIGLIPSKDI